MRNLSVTAICFAIGCQSCSVQESKKTISEKPNIIFFMDDQHRCDALGFIDSSVITPNLDSLARTGVFYRQAVCQAPMSVASRNSLMLGLYPNQIGTLRNEPGLSDEMIPSMPLPEMLRNAGYETAGFGKMHWGRLVSTRGYEVRYDAECREIGSVMMQDIDSIRYARYNEEIKDFGPGEENNKGYIGCVSKLKENEHRDGWITEKCIDYINKRVDKRPLFLYFSLYKPHAGHNVPARFDSLYNYSTAKYAQQPQWDKEYSPHAEGINRRDMYINFWKNATKEEWQTMTTRYRVNCTWMDSMFGDVLQALRAKRLLENSIVIYVSDHGEMLGERYYRFNKYCLYEHSVRVPMIISGTALAKELVNKIDDRSVELVDIYTTLMKIAGYKDTSMFPGIDLLGKETRSANFCSLHERPKEAAFMWRNKDYKLILCFKRKKEAEKYTKDDIINGEFYDLKNDPNEWYNLYGSENSFKSVKETMENELLNHLKTLKKVDKKSIMPEYN